MKRSVEVFKNDFMRVSEVYNNFRFTTQELEIIAKYFNDGEFLGDGVKYNSIIEMKRDLSDLLNVIDIAYIFRELDERDNYQVEIYDWSYPVEASSILYKNLNKGSAKRIRDYLWKKVYDDENINVEYLDIDYVISWWSDGEYHHYQ